MSDPHHKAHLSRRKFLVAATAAAASATIAKAAPGLADTTVAAQALSPPPPLKPPIRLGIVGGHFGAQFYWHEHPDCKVIAVADLIPERRDYLKETYHAPEAYDSLAEMLEKSKLDAVGIFTGATDTVDHCIACLDRGLHVVSASPAAMNLPDARRLRDAVHSSGLTYMMAETSFYHQSVISARNWYRDGLFGDIFSSEAEYHHPGLEKLFIDDNGNRTWRYGLPPMLYSTHCTAQVLGVTGERLTSVTCQGWGDDSPILKDNQFKNPYWCETAMFKTNMDNAFRAQVFWRGATGIAERATWYGSKMSFFSPTANGSGPIIRRSEQSTATRPDGRRQPIYEKHDQTLWWQTDILPEPLRHISGHDGSHTFLTHEFIDALTTGRTPAIPIDMALDMAIPGIVAHQSAISAGKQLSIPSVKDL